ncbi:MAG: diguanylate cyclase [Clostridia bacterium]|nr:diguanylate cyclase [Clostridia bacterium]
MRKLLILVLFVLAFAASTIFPINTALAEVTPDFSKLLGEHGAIMFLLEPQTGEILYANGAAVEFYGFKKAELEAMKITQINTLSPEEIAKEMREAAEEKRNYFVFEHRLANGEIRTVESFPYPVVYQNKTALFTVVHDVTEKGLLEKKDKNLVNAILIGGGVLIIVLVLLLLLILRNRRKLKERHEEIENLNTLRKTFIDADESLTYLKDENLKYLFVNKALEDFYGVSAEQILGHEDYDFNNKDLAEKIKQSDSEVLKQGRLLVDGIAWNNRYYKTTKFPVKLVNGKFGVGAYIDDVTEEHNLDKKRKKVLFRNRLLVDVLNRTFQSEEEQLDYILNHSLKLTESKFGYIYLYDEDKQEFTLNSWSGEVMKACTVRDKRINYELAKTGIWGEVVRQRKPIIVNDFAAFHSLKKGYPEGHVLLSKYMSIPVIIDGKIVAAVGLANKEQDYDNTDVYETTVLMAGVWNAVKRREALESLCYERNKYRQTLISIGDGVMVVDDRGNIEILNNVAERLTGWSLEEAHGLPYKEVFVLSHEDPECTINDPIEDVFRTDTVQELGNHALLTSRDGSNYHLEDSAAPIKDSSGTTMGVVLVFRDVTDKKEQRKRIEYLSFHDSLTGLYNRRFFEDQMLRLNNENSLPISIIMGDVNGLKLTNDVFGHNYGDMLLERLAEVMQKVCRKQDVIARWGGDEFVILLPKTGRKETERIMAKIKTEFAKEHIKALEGSVSMGCDTKEEPNTEIMQILATAEERMYAAKSLERYAIKSNVIKAILNKLHENSEREKNHSARVSELAQALGKALDLSETEIYKLKEAGLMHDIGKIVLEPKLLNGNQPLSKSERNEVKRHSIVGYRILNSFDDTIDLAEVVLAHHERWDGTGYPKGLKGEEIPELARIITLAESYDRMTDASNNAKAKSKAEAICAIRENAGKQFDPQMAQLFIKMLEAENS